MSQKQKKAKNKFKSKTRQSKKLQQGSQSQAKSQAKVELQTLPATKNAKIPQKNQSLDNKKEKTWLPFGHKGPCSQLAECGACPLLPLTASEQYEWKRQNLSDYFAHYSCLQSVNIHLDAHLFNQTQPDVHYRYSAKPSVRPGLNDQAPFKIGLYQPKSHNLVDLEACLAQSPLINALFDSLRVFCPAVGLKAYQHSEEHDSSCRLRYIVIRQGEHASATKAKQPALYLTLIVLNAEQDKLMTLVGWLRNKHPELSGVAVHENHLSGNAIFDFSKPSTLLWGEPALYHHLKLTSDIDPLKKPLKIQVSATSFTQVNPVVAERAYRKVVEQLNPQPNDLVIDLYCGVGSIGLLLAQQARLNGGPLKKLWGLEETQSSINDALTNAEHNHIHEAEFILGRAEDQLDLLKAQLDNEMIQEKLPKKLPNKDSQLLIALNPSRRGCHPNVLEAITRLKPNKIVYMSCHARTLSRDLSLLASLGYQTQETTLFDMFPGSFHYETVSLLIPNHLGS